MFWGKTKFELWRGRRIDSQAQKLVALLLLSLFSLPLICCSAGGGTQGSAKRNGDGNGGYGQPVHLADLQNQAVNESSGIAASRRNRGIFWTHNDSGDGPFLYAFDRQGKHRGVWRVSGADAQDWEDMAIGPGPRAGRWYIYAGDIGDNSKKRDQIVVYRIIEPVVASNDSSSTKQQPKETERTETIRIKYPDGKHDAETLLVHPITGDLYVVTKLMGSPASIYKLKAPIDTSVVATFVKVGAIEFPNTLRGFITGGDISPDGRRVVLCDYMGACEYVLAEKNANFDDIWNQQPVLIDCGKRRQGEAICYGVDGKSLFATSEGVPCPLIEIPQSINRK